MIFSTGVFVAAVIVGSAAQNLGNISPACQAAAAGVLTGPASSCLGVTGLMNIATTKNDQSLVGPIDSWLATTCAQPACTDATIDAVITNVTSGCSSDLSSLGVTDHTIQKVKPYIEELYPVVREIACLKDSGSSDQFCVTETLKAVENIFGLPLSVDNIQKLSQAISNQAPIVNSAAKTLACTPCAQAAWGIIRPKLDSENQRLVEEQFNGLCGSGFADAAMPASIKKTANTAAAGSGAGSSNGAMSLSLLGSMAAVAFGAVGAVAAVL